MEFIETLRHLMPLATFVIAVSAFIAILGFAVSLSISPLKAGQKILETKIDAINGKLSRQDTEIQSTDKKIDDLKNSLLSKQK